MIWHLAGNSLRSRPLRTTLTAAGIAVAVASTIVFLSLGEGLRQTFGRELGAIGPDIQVSYGPFDATASLTSLPELPFGFLETLQQAAEAFGIQHIVPLLFHLRTGLSATSSFLFQGLPPDEEIASLYADYHIVEGRDLQADDRELRVAVIGRQVAERHGLEIGEGLRLNPGSSFEIIGISESAGGLTDNAILVPLRALQEAIGIRDRVSFLVLHLEEPARAAEIAEALEEAYPDLGFQTRSDVLGVIEQGIRISDVVRLGISTIALIVGAIAVANTMMMSVFERTREFGVVRAVGAKPRFLFGLVLAEATLLSVAGAAIGVLVGQLGIFLVNRIARDLIGLEVAALTLRLLLFALAIAIAMGLLSGLVPATRAARLPIATAVARE